MRSPTTTSLLDDLAAVAVLLLGLAALSWPALWSGARGFAQYDASFTQIATEHLQDVVLHGASWRDAPLGWPLAFGAAQADWQAGQALLGLPLRLLDIDPSRAAFLLSLSGLLASGFAGHRLARALLGQGPHTWLAGVLCGPSTIALAHSQHVNLVHHELMLVGALALGGGLVAGKPGWTALGGAAFGLCFHLGVYMGLHGALVAAVLLAAAALARLGTWRSWGAAALALGLAAGTVWPVLSMYQEADLWLDTEIAVEEQLDGSWDPSSFADPIANATLHSAVGDSADGPRTPGSPGYLVLVLSLVGLLTWRHLRPRWAWGAVTLVVIFALSLAMGPEIQWRGEGTGFPGPNAWLLKLPGFEDLRQPHRWLLVAFPALGLLAAAGLRALLGGLPLPAKLPLCLLAIGIAFGEAPRQRTTQLDRMFLPEVYRVLGQLSTEGAVWEQIARSGRRACSCADETLMRAALLYRRPLAAVNTARKIPALAELRRKVADWPSSRAAGVLVQIGVVAVVEHPPLTVNTPASAAGWTCQQVADHRLCTFGGSGAASGYAAPPLYTGLSVDASWLPPLPVRDRDPSIFLPSPPVRR